MLLKCALALLLGFSGHPHPDNEATISDSINSGVRASDSEQFDWEKFLGQQNLSWQKMPNTWGESPFLGNGWLGTMIYQNGGNEQQLRIEVHHAGVTDHRDGSGMFETARLPIGHFIVETKSRIRDCDLTLDLWNAELKGTINTEGGSFDIRAIVSATEMVLVTELKNIIGEAAPELRFVAAKAISPRLLKVGPGRRPENYPDNPAHAIDQVDSISICDQRLISGGGHATAWKVVEAEGKKTLLASVAHSFPKMNYSESAVRAVKKAAEKSYDSLLKDHQNWWHSFYPTSFVSIPDGHWQSFYWIQMYKMGASTRANGSLIDNHGPWLQPTPWPYATWNLNVQLSYWPFNASGHLREAASLPNHLTACQEQLKLNVLPAEFRSDSSAIGRAATETLNSPLFASSHGHREVGNLPWAMHNVWLQYRHTMDEAMLRDTIFPLLKRSMNLYLHLLEEKDGRWHLPTTYSPEYGDAENCNYDLSLIRWSCETLLRINDRLELNDSHAKKWQDVLQRLVDYPGDDQQGFYIGKDVKYSKSHRHYSHLMMVYPLYLVNIEQPGGRERIEKSIDRWHAFPKSLLGYSFTGSASMYAALGYGDKALKKLDGLKRFLKRNTMYAEGGPVIETPLSAAQSIHDMLVQSWGNRIRVFPAVPAVWKDVVIDRLRTEGAFELSASRQDGATRWVRLKSLAGEPFEIRLGMDEKVNVTAGEQYVDQVENDLYRITLPAGTVAEFVRDDYRGEIEIVPVETSKFTPFGLPAE